MPTTSVPFYFDWTFWSFAAAAVAILLSQLPPLREMLGRAKLRLEVHGAMQVTHMVGHPNLSMYLVARNLGKRPARIVAITARIERAGRPPLDILCQQYYLTPMAEKPVLFVPFTLEPGEERGHSVRCYILLDPQEDRKLGTLRQQLTKDLSEKYRAREQTASGAKGLAEADATSVDPLIALFNKEFMWTTGEYTLRLILQAEDTSLNCTSSFRFTLYEGQEAELRSYPDDYKHGLGPAVDSPKHGGVWVRLMPV
jgi:hypothetical protein